MSLRWMVAILAVSLGVAYAFSGYEHREIGDIAFHSAIAALEKAAPGASTKLLTQPHMSSGMAPAGGNEARICAVASGRDVVCFSFGEMLAIYGDFAETFDEMNSAAIGNRAPALKEIVTKGNYTDFADEKRHMIELAAKNATHFSGEAAQTYVKWHKQALALAPQKDRLWEALHYEALALHSYTDLFALGHMLENRQTTAALVKWAEEEKLRLSSLAATAGSGGMGAWVNFYHNGFNWKGAMVRNLAGESWHAFGDARYRSVDASCPEKGFMERRRCSDTETKNQRDIAVRGAAVSVLGVLTVASGRPLAAGTEYAALAHAPIDYSGAHAPVHPGKQMPQIMELAVAMQRAGRPLADNGFDFNLGILKVETAETSGRVPYADYLRQTCGPACSGR